MKLEKEIKEIKERNRRVEIDKAWEVSWTRRFLLAVLTYIVVVLFFIMAGLPNPFINPIVPTIGFLISTMVLNFFKTIWIRSHKK